MAEFMFATGIECSYPTIDGGRWRIDQLKETRHYENWKRDLELVREVGLRYLRYGPPLHLIFQAPDKYDWTFTDRVWVAIIAWRGHDGFGYLPINLLVGRGVTLPGTIGHVKSVLDSMLRRGELEKVIWLRGTPTRAEMGYNERASCIGSSERPTALEEKGGEF